MKKSRESWMNNRDVKLLPRRGLFWCSCDINRVGRYTKCKICGRRNGSRTNKGREL